MLKVLFVASGKSFHATRWANSLSDKGYEVYFFTCIALERPLNSNVKVIQAGKKYHKLSYIFKAIRLRRCIKKISPDVVHAHYSSGNGFLAALGTLFLNVKFFTSLYGSEIYRFPKKSILHKLILTFVFSKADCILSTSHDMKREYQKLFPNSRLPIVTPFGVDINLFSPKENFFKASFKIGIVKKLEYVYGIDIFIRAMYEYYKMPDSPDCTVLIAGGGSKKDELQVLVESLGLKSKIEFSGWIDNKDVPIFINELDLFIVPSRQESFGVAAVEALSCGVPVLASDVGGLPEIVDDGKNGCLFPIGDYCELAKIINNILSDPEKLEKMSLSARKKVVDQYDWNKTIMIVEEAYKRN